MTITPLHHPSHETVLRIEDPGAGLLGFIAVHSTVLGPAAGGLRMRDYGSEAEALVDVLRLSEGMSQKNAAAGLPLGGGKAVIMGDPAGKTQAQLRAFAAAIDSLNGQYWTAEDMGMRPDDMATIREVTPYVAGLEAGSHASGDPSPITARGIFQSIRTVARHRFGAPELEGRRVAVQGLGHVGLELAVLLKAAGAHLIVSDVNAARAGQAAQWLGAEVVEPGAILSVKADILAPCAVGGILNAQTIADLRVEAVCGGANNQLATPADAGRLAERDILYAPDYIVNAGGIINVATEILSLPDRAGFVEEKLADTQATLEAVLEEAKRAGRTPVAVADEIVARRIAPRDAA